MSISPEIVEFPGKKLTPGKPSFSQRCTMLSQYLKEKGTFGDLTLGIMTSSSADAHPSSANDMLRHSPAAAAMTLFPLSNGHANHQMGCSLPPPPSSHHQQPMNLFPQKAGFYDSPKLLEPSANKPASPTSQLTIFYGGQVIVFNDFPADKAEEVMLMASKGSAKSQTAADSTFAPSVTAKTPIVSSTTSVATPVIPTSGIVTSFTSNMIQDCIQVQQAPKPITCDLPIARRASLHRFLEKRKDRITARAPYQTSNGSESAHTLESKLGSAESNSWLGLVSQSPPSTHC